MPPLSDGMLAITSYTCAHTQHVQNILAQFNASREVTRKQLEEGIAEEASMEGVLECRKEVFEILRVSSPCPAAL